MKIYTRTGDGGQTSLRGGARTSKASLRVEAIGAVDEANAALGLAATYVDGEMKEQCTWIQSRMFDIGAALASTSEDPYPLSAGAALQLEAWIDAAEANLEPLKAFILPGGSRASAQLHVTRGIVRRAERSVVALKEAERREHANIVVFLNRLSDWAFVMARAANRQAGVADEPWRKEKA